MTQQLEVVELAPSGLFIFRQAALGCFLQRFSLLLLEFIFVWEWLINMEVEPKYYVLHAACDDSHSLVANTDVVCCPPVSIGDAVKFVYGSRKNLIDGVVKAIGGKHSLSGITV